MRKFVSHVSQRGIAAAAAFSLHRVGRGDRQTTDLHPRNEGATHNINSLVHGFLVDRDTDRKVGLRPALAESWTQVASTLSTISPRLAGRR